MKLDARKPQSQAKHFILENYLQRWARIISYGLRRIPASVQRKPSFKIHFVYVDGFGYCGRYAGDEASILLSEPQKDIVYGSPIIGVSALDRIKRYTWEQYHIRIQVNAIVTEKIRDFYNELLESFAMAGMGSRVQETNQFDTLNDEDIAVVNGDFHEIVDKALAYTRDPTFSFYFIDPYGPTGIPLDIVNAVITQKKTDTIINFPFLDFIRKTGVTKNKKLVENWTRVFNDNGKWRDIYNSHTDMFDDGELARQKAEDAISRYYARILEDLDNNLVVKYESLQFPDKERTIFYLFLTTRDPSGALALNEVIYQGKLKEVSLRWQYQYAQRVAKEGQLGFDFVRGDSSFQSDERAFVEEIAEKIYRKFQGQKVQYGDVQRLLAEDVYFDGEIKRALTQLKKASRAQYAGSIESPKTAIAFLS